MSKFLTALPTHYDALKAALPKGAIVQHVQLSGNLATLEIHWTHDDLRTPFTVATALTVAQATGKEPLPLFVKVRDQHETDVKPASETLTREQHLAAMEALRACAKTPPIRTESERVPNAPVAPRRPKKVKV